MSYSDIEVPVAVDTNTLVNTVVTGSHDDETEDCALVHYIVR